MRVPAAVVLAVLAIGLISAEPSLAAGPPLVEGTGVTDVQGVSALLTGEVNPAGSATSFHFEYVDQTTFAADQPAGFAHALATAEAGLGAGSAGRAATAGLSGLSPNTTYHYRLVARNGAGTTVGPEQTFVTTRGFGFRPGADGFEVRATEPDGSADNRAGSHPYALTTKINLNLAGEFAGQPGAAFSDGDLRDLQLELPPGLIENPSAVLQCSQAEFHTSRESPFESSLAGESCPGASQIGVVTVRSSFAGGSTRHFGVFNLTPPPGAPSQIGFSPYGVPIVLTPTVNGVEGSYAVNLNLEDFSQRFDLLGLELTMWGAPWKLSHDRERGNCLNEGNPGDPYGKCSVGRPLNHRPKAYLTLPASCGAPLTFTARATSWQQPESVEAVSVARGEGGQPLPLEGCGQLALSFNESASVLPTGELASTPTGLDFNLEIDPAALTNPDLLAPSQAKKAVVTLPEGVTINPSLAAGLGSCTPAQYAAESLSSNSAGCPTASKIGTLSVISPLFEGAVSGSVYLAEPDDPATPAPESENPFDSLLAVYLVARSAERGVLVKVAGRIDTDPSSGRIVATFDDLPQLPYTDFKVHFREGNRSPLLTPPSCGSYDTSTAISPWMEPTASRDVGSHFTISKGVSGGACPNGISPFAPAAQAGMLNAQAGAYTPFYLHLTRTDADQEITSYSAKLPPGLLGAIAGVPFCSDAAIEAAKQQTGFETEEEPPCPAASEIGRTETGYGVGSVLAFAPGRLYLAGPYKGSPLSIVAVDAAVVGPFDLGTIVIRSAIDVDRSTAQISIDSAASDPIPHILRGIPLRLRDIRVYIDRPHFTLNPTNCESSSVVSSLTGAGARFSDPSDDPTATVSDPFRVLFCSSLPFAPKISLRLKGGTKRGDFPSLRAEVRPNRGDANIGRAEVTLPRSEFLEQAHLRNLCTRTQYAAGRCPADSVYGHAVAYTPLLSEPLRGPVYLRSSDHPLPDVVAALQGRGIPIDVVGHIDSYRGGLRGRFDVLPDAPVTKFVFVLNGGRKGVLVNSKNLCAAPNYALARFLGQNNIGEVTRPRVQVKCRKHRSRRKR
jgi:hypothetical protein